MSSDLTPGDGATARDAARLRYEGRAFRDGEWLPWHPIAAVVYENRQKWPRDGYEVRAAIDAAMQATERYENVRESVEIAAEPSTQAEGEPK